MGLLRRKHKGRADAESLEDVLETLRRRLDESDREKERLRVKLHVVAETNMALDDRFRALDAARAALDLRVEELDTARADLDDRVGMISSNTANLQERVGFVGELSSRVQELTDRLVTDLPTVPPPPSPTDPRIDELVARLDTLAEPAALAELADRLDILGATVASQHQELAAAKATIADMESMRSQMAQMTKRIMALDGRVRGVSLELTNQLTELSNDLERLNDLAVDGDPRPKVDPDQLQLELSVRVDQKVDIALGAIQKSTERLAAEQARYEIQFREDLAELADRLRRPVVAA